MKYSLKDLKGYSLQATDGEKGKIKNFLFDDETWTIRYVEAELGSFLKEKRVLIPKEQLGQPQENKHFTVKLTIKSIENAPDLGYDLPVSRKHEQELFDYYGLVPYWPANIGMFPGRESMYYPGQIIAPPKKVGKVEENDTHLRSFHEVKGYFIKAADDSFGHVEDLIIDDSDWQILYAIIDTKNLVPWSKQVMLPIELIDEISFFDKEAKINLTKEAIKDAPEYNPEDSISAEYEKVLKDFYGRKMIV